MEHATEIEGIKKELRTTQDSVLLIHQDLKQMSRGITEMSASMKIMVEVQSDMRLINERIESRHLAQKATNERLDGRIDATNKTIKDKSEVIENQARNGNAAYTALKWIAGILGTLLITSAFGSWLYVLSIQGVN
jgi:hypothetical protein